MIERADQAMQDPAKPETSAPRGLSGWLRPTRAARWGVIVVVWLACVFAASTLLFMQFEDTPLSASSRRELGVAYVAFMCRTFTLHGAIAAIFFAGVALLVRQRVAAGLLVVWAIAFAWPALSLLAGREPAPATAASREVRIISMNVLLTNTDPAPALAFIREHDPDVVMLQEYTPAWHKAMADELAAKYPYIINEMRQDAFGQAVFSKHPWKEEPVLRLSDESRAASSRVSGVQGLHDPQIRVVIDIAGRELVLQNVHTVPTVGRGLLYEQRVQFAEFIRLAKRETRPMLMTGDFNATANSRHMTKLLEAGMRDANAVAGAGLGHTWPDLGPLRYLPGIRIDHVLFNSRVLVHRHVVGPSIGSDHRPLLTCITMQ
jgi:endonuclease/exonuclease/phosphatase (EEP) superfamily protein YafD